MSMRLPSASVRSSSRQRNACVRTRAPGYHLNGTVTLSASWPRTRSSSTRASLKISAPPRANGTWGLTTAIRIVALVLRVAKHRHLCLEPVDLLLQVVDQAKRSSVERALVVRKRLDVPTHRLPQNRLDGRSDPAAHARTQSQRPVCRNGPEALRLGACGAPIVRVAVSAARIGARPSHLLAQRREQRCDIDGLGASCLGRRNPCSRAVFVGRR